MKRRSTDRLHVSRRYGKRHKRQKRKATSSCLLPLGSYRTIVADPGWSMKFIRRRVRPNQVCMPYRVMTLDEIMGYPIGDLVHADGSHLFLWTTQRWLPPAMRVMEAWGFRYVFCMIWHKPGGYQPYGLPQYNSEFVLYGRRGSARFLTTKAFPTCFSAPRTGHSRKPDEFFELIRRVCPPPRISVFERWLRPGFDVSGDEAPTHEEMCTANPNERRRR